MPTWTVAPSSPRLPAATPSWSPMKALPLRPRAGKVCRDTICLERAREGLWRAISPSLAWDSVLRLWALEIAGMKGFEGGGGRMLWVHMGRAEWFCRAAGPSPPEAGNSPSPLRVGILLSLSCPWRKADDVSQASRDVVEEPLYVCGGAGCGQPCCVFCSSCVP